MKRITSLLVVFAGRSYLYLRTRSSNWPPGLLPPRPTAGTVNLLIFFLSVVPAIRAQKVAQRGNLLYTRIAIFVMSLMGAANLVARVYFRV